MENTESLSPATRAGIVLVGAIQGFICYLVTWYIGYAGLPADSFWLVCVVPATVVLSTTLALSVTSFKQRSLWLALAAIVLAVAGMGGGDRDRLPRLRSGGGRRWLQRRLTGAAASSLRQ